MERFTTGRTLKVDGFADFKVGDKVMHTGNSTGPHFMAKTGCFSEKRNRALHEIELNSYYQSKLK